MLWRLFSLFRSFKPLTFFGLLAIFTSVLALICGWGPVESYVRVGQVHQLPRAVLATGLALLSAGMAFLGLLLHACVHDGASVGFVLPFAATEACRFWNTSVLPSVASGGARLFVARDGARIVGSVVLGLDMMPNQSHRADVSKLLVHPDYRRKGIARHLMQALLEETSRHDRSLLVLDTRSGDPSQVLYASLGFQVAGQIPRFCRNPHGPALEPTTYMYLDLSDGT